MDGGPTTSRVTPSFKTRAIHGTVHVVAVDRAPPPKRRSEPTPKPLPEPSAHAARRRKYRAGYCAAARSRRSSRRAAARFRRNFPCSVPVRGIRSPSAPQHKCLKPQGDLRRGQGGSRNSCRMSKASDGGTAADVAQPEARDEPKPKSNLSSPGRGAACASAAHATRVFPLPVGSATISSLPETVERGERLLLIGAK